MEVKEKILVFIGRLFFFCTKLYIVSIGKYKTFVLKKHNPNMLYVGYKTVFNKDINITIGKNSYINGGILYTKGESKIVIGNNVMISHDVVMRTDMHNYHDLTQPMINQGVYSKNIIIEDDVWIGWGAYIMPGVTIHKGAIVGAGAVVTHDVLPFSIVGGVPAKLISKRK